MRKKLSRQEVIRKAIMVFEAIRRMTSRGGAGLTPEKGAEEEYDAVDDCTQQLREILREMMENDRNQKLQRVVEERYERSLHAADGLGRDDNVSAVPFPEEREWQKEIRQAGGPPERMLL